MCALTSSCWVPKYCIDTDENCSALGMLETSNKVHGVTGLCHEYMDISLYKQKQGDRFIFLLSLGYGLHS